MKQSQKKPKISFVVPLYNKQAFVSECLWSLRGQTLKDIEIIVVDDCSKDDSLDIVKWHMAQDPRVKLIRLKTNKGRSFARNVGNKRAEAPIICVQDADDLAIKERAQITYDYFKKHKNIDIMYGSFFVGNDCGEIGESVGAIAFDIERVKKTGVTFIGHSTMAYKKELNVKYPNGKWSALGLDDFKLQIDLYKKGYKFGFVNEHLMIYRQNSNSISLCRNATAVYKAKGQYLKTI